MIVADPYLLSYSHLVKWAGAVPVTVDSYDDFRLRPEGFEAAITQKTKMILFNSPSNPTGTIHKDEDVRAVSALAQKHDLLIISDEIYEKLTYDGPSPSPVRYAPERTLLLRGFSKSYAMTGWRMGFAAGPSAVISEMTKLQQYTFVCAPQPFQWACIEAMDTDMSQHVATYKTKRDRVCQALQEDYEFTYPSGGFYVFPRVPSKYENATQLGEEAIRRQLLIVPGGVFSSRDTHFRISYATSDEKLARGCEILRAMATDN